MQGVHYKGCMAVLTWMHIGKDMLSMREAAFDVKTAQLIRSANL